MPAALLQSQPLGKRAKPDVRRPPLVGPPRPWPQPLLSRLREGDGGAPSALEQDRLRQARSAVPEAGEGLEGLSVRLSDVRTMRTLLDRHVLPDELPEDLAQRPLRRRPPERPLRGEAR